MKIGALSLLAGLLIASYPGCDQDGDGYSPNEGDCNDADPDVNPNIDEAQCDGLDADCDGTVEDVEHRADYPDIDGDGYGDNDGMVYDCIVDDSGRVMTGGDCDDADASIKPTAQDVCGDAVDNNCDGLIDNDPGC